MKYGGWKFSSMEIGGKLPVNLLMSGNKSEFQRAGQQQGAKLSPREK
jgi:hypothetical protein